MKIETLPIAQLLPYQRNARTHSRKQIRQIANSIERFGFCNPVLIDDDNRIIAGHGRVEAAKLLGIKEVPAVRLSHLSDAEKRAYILADNRLAEKAGWDREIVVAELQGLIDIGFDIDLTGFEPADVDLMIEEVSDVEDRAENDVPEYRKERAVSEPGDLWVLGNHLLMCGDARDEDAYTHLMGRDRAEFVFTDPPYNVPIDGHVCGLGRVRHEDFAMGCGEMSTDQFTDFLSGTFELMCRYSIDGSIHQVCMDWRHMREMLAAGYARYAELKNPVSGTSPTPAWDRSTGPSTSWCSSGSMARLRTSTISSSGSMAGRVPTSGTTTVSTRCVPAAWTNWRCIRP
jgi:hypothetical protein